MNKKTRLISVITLGNIIEWYDFCLFGYFAPLLGQTFFPHNHPHIALFYTYLIFACSGCFRFIGGVIFGIIGDTRTYGLALYLSILWIIIPTLGIGLLPSPVHIGLAAPLLLTVVRCMQGIAAGGQYSGSLVFAKKTFSTKGALGGSFAYLGSLLGLLLASLIGALSSASLKEPWSWRFPFLVSVVFIFGLKFCKASLLQDKSSSTSSARATLVKLLANHRSTLLKATLLTSLGSVYYFSFFVFLISYLSLSIKLPMATVLIINTLCLISSGIICVAFAGLADKIGRKPLMVGSSIALVLTLYPAFLVINQGSFWPSFLGTLCLVGLNTIFFAAAEIVIVELFPSSIRYIGSAIAYNAGVLVGCSVPAGLTLLLMKADFHAICIALMICAGLGTGFIFRWVPETLKTT